jgi:hypothetical protein
MARLPSESGILQFPDWQCAYEEALHETSRVKRPECLKAARAAIFSRLKAKLERPPGTLERIALNDAIHLLGLMRNTRL